MSHANSQSFPLQLIFHGEKEIKMLYIFDLGNVIVDIDFNRVLGAWSDFSRVPLATLKQISRWARLSISMSAVKSVMKILPSAVMK
jgi:hypothetical protein